MKRLSPLSKTFFETSRFQQILSAGIPPAGG
jgi:hypothetical protein